MYADKDKSGKISLMDITTDEAKDMASILLEFEQLLTNYSNLNEREKVRLHLFSTKCRFQIIDELKII